MNLALTQRAFPGATVVLSTLVSHSDALRNCSADTVVFSNDPGPLPPYKWSRNCSVNNINRQIVTSGAGLARVTTPYAAKIRTDCALQSMAWCNLYDRLQAIDPSRERIIVNSFYTLHPLGIEAFPFHVSDWCQFGRTDTLREYWDVTPLALEDAVWFESRPHTRKSSYFAKLYKARFAPEQYVSIAYARKRGYRIPRFIDDNGSVLVAEYERFLAMEFAVCQPQALGLVFNKYAHLSSSDYQFFNCVSGRDWVALCEKHLLPTVPPDEIANLFGESVPALDERTRHRAVKFVRAIDALLPLIKWGGLMPIVGQALALYRQ